MGQHITDTQNIIDRRDRYNRAIADCDVAAIAQYWMEDIIVISGEGGQYIGKKMLVKVFKEMFVSDPPVFVRNPKEVIVGDSGILAWETGIWHYETASFRGNYSAMWRKIENQWLLQSELFVSLD